jgi:hypothetical protein
MKVVNIDSGKQEYRIGHNISDMLASSLVIGILVILSGLSLGSYFEDNNIKFFIFFIAGIVGIFVGCRIINSALREIRILWDFKKYAPFCGSRGLYDGNSFAADGAPNNEFISQIESHRSPLTGIVVMSAEDWESIKTVIREAGRSNHVN